MTFNAADSSGLFNVGVGLFNISTGTFNIVPAGGGGSGSYIELEATGHITLEDGSGAILLE